MESIAEVLKEKFEVIGSSDFSDIKGQWISFICSRGVSPQNRNLF